MDGDAHARTQGRETGTREIVFPAQNPGNGTRPRARTRNPEERDDYSNENGLDSPSNCFKFLLCRVGQMTFFRPDFHSFVFVPLKAFKFEFKPWSDLDQLTVQCWNVSHKDENPIKDGGFAAEIRIPRLPARRNSIFPVLWTKEIQSGYRFGCPFMRRRMCTTGQLRMRARCFCTIYRRWRVHCKGTAPQCAFALSS